MSLGLLVSAMLGAGPSRAVVRPRLLSRTSSSRCSASTSSIPADAVDAAFMRFALAEAAAAGEAGEVPIGAVLTMGGEVVALGRNQVEQLGDASAHAEMLCLRAAAAATGNWRLNLRPSTLYVTVEPCPMCLAAIFAFRVERLVYAAPNPRLGAVLGAMRIPAEHPFHRMDVSSGVLAAEAAGLMQGFFRRRRVGSEALAAEGAEASRDGDSGYPEATQTINN
jgi:tRNA(adenine34) deaminase